MNPLSDIVKGGFEGLLNTVTDTVDKFTLQKEEKAALIEQFQSSARQFELELNTQIVELERIEAERVANARQMQIEALKQDGWLPKNFIYLLSIFTIVMVVLLGVSLLYVDIPEKNRRMFEMLFDFALTGALAAVFNFFLGSSMGSKRKQDLLTKTQVPTLEDSNEALLTERQRRKRLKE